MKTIYERMLEKEARIFNEDLNSVIIPKLVHLLNQLCDIDLNATGTCFKPYMIYTGSTIYGHSLKITYRCQYCEAIVSLKDNKLSVYFSFFNKDLGHYKIPLNADRCAIDVDHQLNFKQAVFNYYANFSKLKIDRNCDGHVYSSLNITRNIDSNFNQTNSVSYLNGATETSDYIDLKDFNLNSIFFEANNRFDKLLVDATTFCEYNPKEFYNVFPEYPTYVEFMTNIEKATEFLNLFYAQYTDDVEILTSRILLLDMQAI
jgi:hypothetical protein